MAVKNQGRTIAIPVALAGSQSPKDIETVDKIINDQLAKIEAVTGFKEITGYQKMNESHVTVFYTVEETTTTSDGE